MNSSFAFPFRSGGRAPPGHSPSRGGQRAAPSAPDRILVVDDNHDAADTLGILLKCMGSDVHTTYDGESALQAVRDYQPVMVLLDLGMPGLDGYEVARRLRARSTACPILVALTGWGQDEDRRKSKAAGFDHHLVKPVDLAALEALFATLRT